VDDRIARLESSVAHLQQTIQSLQQRLDMLETRLPAGATGQDSAAAGALRAGAVAGPAARAAKQDPRDPIVILTLIGRLFLVLAGGFFLRAMTDSGVMAPPLGLSVGFLYAMLWLVFADRAGGRQEQPSALFHGLATAMIAFPLLVEAATKFKVLHGTPSALAVAILTAAMLFVAWHQRLRGIAWIAVIGAAPTSAILLSQTGAVVPFALLLIVLGVVTLWFGYALDWWGLRWPAALAADLAVVGVTLRALAPTQPDPPQVAMLMQMTLLGAYVVSIAIRTLIRGRNVVPFEVAQTAAALVVGFGGALYLTSVTGILPATIGMVSLVLGLASYGVALAFLDRRKDNGANVYYYTTLALVHVIAGIALVLASSWTGVVFAVLGVLFAWLWARFGRSFMLVHGAVYLLAAGIVAGTVTYCLRLLAAPPTGPWVAPGTVMPVVMLAAALASWWVSARRSTSRDEILSALRLLVILVFVSAAAACVIGYLAPVVGALPDRSVDIGVVATVSTAVLAVSTLVIAWLGRMERFRELSWLVYPLLVGIGVKMAAQDFKHSRPATLFIAMALFGAALIVAPRLRRAAAKADPSAGSAA